MAEENRSVDPLYYRNGTRSRARVARVDRGVNVAHTAAMERRSGDGLPLPEATLQEIGRAFDEGQLTAERLVQVCLARIEAYDRRGPRINAVINLNPRALERARELDLERERGGARGPLHGIPVAVKDTIDVAGMPTTGGFTALTESVPVRDAAAVRRLHDAGAVILAKVNANDWFGQAPLSASTLGGQTLNPHHLDYVPGGSSRAAVCRNHPAATDPPARPGRLRRREPGGTQV